MEFSQIKMDTFMSKKTTTVVDKKVKRGERMTLGKGWKLVHEDGDERVFSATLKATINEGKTRLAIFVVPK